MVAVVVPREERQVGAHGVVIVGAELLLVVLVRGINLPIASTVDKM